MRKKKNMKEKECFRHTVPIIHRSSTDGITLVALVVTIVVLLILAGITISYIFGNNSIFGKASEAGFKNRMSKYNEEVNLWVNSKILENLDNNTKYINSGDPLIEVLEMLEESDRDIDISDVNIPIRTILRTLEKRDEKYVAVYEGEMCYVKDPRRKESEKEAQWCRDINIKVLELRVPTGIEVKNGNYEKVNGIYVCTPVLNVGFDKYRTRYLDENENGAMTPGDWIFNKPKEDWYDYGNSKWANVVIENNGVDSSFTWIPRYCFKLDKTKQRADVKLIDIDNSYKDPETDEVTLWKDLEKDGYQVPDAFKFDGKDIPGYWHMKYNIGDSPAPTVINYDMSVSKGIMSLKNTVVNKGESIVKYTIALNGKIMEEVTDVANINKKEFKFDKLKAGDNIVNITGLDATGQMVGSNTKVYAPAVVNPPELTGFDKDTTFYVTYDEDGTEHSTIPISKEQPKGWYEYGSSEWANIVVRNNGGEAYYTWIPRYEFQLDKANQRSTVKFIKGILEEATTGYQIPDAFTFDGKPITGYWHMKYNIGDTGAAAFDTELTATGTNIKTKGITGSGVKDGQVYRYYINGEYKGEKTKATDTFEFKGLQPNAKQTVLVEIRDSSTKQLVGTVVKQAETSEPNKPDLSGFEESCTYYVLYDENGNETIGEKVKKNGSNMPKEWYDYSERKWANIVVKGKDASGKETSTYFTWIPRYQFRLDKNNQRSSVKFLQGTSTTTDVGYQIPDAFTFDGKAITGYWHMKYNIGE